jgi:hypothetical protein
MAVMSTFSLTLIVDEWLLYNSVNTTIHDRSKCFSFPVPKRNHLFKTHNARAKDAGQALGVGKSCNGLLFSVIMITWNHCGGSDMYVWQIYRCIRSIVRYVYDHANIGSKMRLTPLPIHVLIIRTQVPPWLT